jgi:Uma2 family endonuclease
MSRSAVAEAWTERYISLEEWAALEEDEPGEVVDGRLVEEESVGYAHEVIIGWLICVLGNWLASRGGGFVGSSDAKFAVRPTRGRKPDITVYLPGSRKPPAQGLIRVPPDVAIEVVSSTPRDGRRDRVEKVKEYAAFGVKWYWIVDPQFRSLEIFELGADGRYAHALAATEGSLTSLPGFEGLTLDVDALWSELDRLMDESGESDDEASQE